MLQALADLRAENLRVLGAFGFTLIPEFRWVWALEDLGVQVFRV